MPEPAPSPIDPAALDRVLRRLAHAEAAPWLHQEVAGRMAERLAVMRTPAATWLDASGWLGGGRAAVAAQWPQARVTVMEHHPVLAARSRALLRGPWWTGRRPQAAVLALGEEPEGAFGMLWANLMLHAAPDAPALIARWHRALATDGLLMFSCFGPDTLAELAALYAEAGWPAPHPPYTDMHDIGDQLVRAGFADPVMDQEQLVLHWSGPSALLAELRGLGGNLSRGRLSGLRTPRWRQRLEAELARRAGPDGRIRMRFEVVYGHAVKVPPRTRAGDPQVVSLSGLHDRLRNRPPPGNLG